MSIQLERLQVENASEWQKRERLETDKQTLERENRKLHSQMSDLEEQLQRKQVQAAASVDSDLRTLQFDLSEKNKVGYSFTIFKCRNNRGLGLNPHGGNLVLNLFQDPISHGRFTGMTLYVPCLN